MAYHKKYVGSFKPGDNQENAKTLFRKAVGRHIDRTKDHGPFTSPDEEMVHKAIGDIIAKSQREQRERAAAGQVQHQNQTNPQPPSTFQASGSVAQNVGQSASVPALQPGQTVNASANSAHHSAGQAIQQPQQQEGELVKQLQQAAGGGATKDTAIAVDSSPFKPVPAKPVDVDMASTNSVEPATASSTAKADPVSSNGINGKRPNEDVDELAAKRQKIGD